MTKQTPGILAYLSQQEAPTLQEYSAPAQGALSDHSKTKISHMKTEEGQSIIALSSREQSWFPISSLWVCNDLIPKPSPLPPEVPPNFRAADRGCCLLDSDPSQWDNLLIILKNLCSHLSVWMSAFRFIKQQQAEMVWIEMREMNQLIRCLLSFLKGLSHPGCLKTAWMVGHQWKKGHIWESSQIQTLCRA